MYISTIATTTPIVILRTIDFVLSHKGISISYKLFNRNTIKKIIGTTPYIYILSILKFKLTKVAGKDNLN